MIFAVISLNLAQFLAGKDRFFQLLEATAFYNAQQFEVIFQRSIRST